MEESNNIIFLFLLGVIVYFFNKFFLISLSKSKITLLDDNQFNKPQAFHDQSTFRAGGITIFFQLIVFFSYLYFSQNISISEYVSFCTLFFFLGLLYIQMI